MVGGMLCKSDKPSIIIIIMFAGLHMHMAVAHGQALDGWASGRPNPSRHAAAVAEQLRS